jgi:choline/glycine/proline betaine transport protein
MLAWIGLPNGPSWIAATLVALFIFGSVAFIEPASALLESTKNAVVDYFDWLFILVANVAIATVALLAIHPRANVRLGPDDARPEFSRLSWFAMLFSAGLASGMLYWATAEPIIHHAANPFLLPNDPDFDSVAVTTALRVTVLHWGIHGWAFYVLAALAIAIYSYRHGQTLSFRTALFPILGSKQIDRWPGKVVDLLALFGTVCGVATSIGLSASSMNATLQSLFRIDLTLSNQIWIIFGVCALGIASASSGLARGVRWLSEVNIWVSTLLLIAFALMGPTLYIAGVLAQTLVDYVVHFIPAGLWLADSTEDRAWQSAWTIFYWGWWLAWTPFVSLFIARISFGRSLREFAVAVMLVPPLMTLVWMSVLGGTAIAQERANPGAVLEAVNADYSLGLVTVIENLAAPPMATILIATAAFLLFTWLITSLDSATLMITHLLGSEDSTSAKIFWGFALAGVSAVLLRVGGLNALQAASVIIGLPLAGLLLLLAAGLVRDLVRDRI